MMAKSREVDGERMVRNTRSLKTLQIGTQVVLLNQSGRSPNKWDKTGLVVEIRPHEQIVVKVDGSRRLTLRNRRFVRELDPRKTSLEDPLSYKNDPEHQSQVGRAAQDREGDRHRHHLRRNQSRGRHQWRHQRCLEL